MPGVILAKTWSCGRCTSVARTADAKLPHHPCRGLSGLMVPLVLDGTKADVRPVEREDYVNGELVQLLDRRPVMATVTTRDDGQDCTVYAPTAQGRRA